MFTGKDYYYLLTPFNTEGISTDSGLLHKKILDEIFGVSCDNLKNYVAYATTVEAGERAVREGNANYAFYLTSMSSSELYGLAECGVCMPKRTNRFYPGLMTGIIMNKIDE